MQPQGAFMAQISTLQKYTTIIEEFKKRADATLDAYDAYLQETLLLQPKQLGRLLDELSATYESIVVQKEKNKKRYKLIKPIDIFIEAFENANEIGWLFSMAQEGDPELFKKLSEYTNEQKHIYLFKNSPFEDIKTLEAKETFKKLKRAVELKEYRKIKFFYEDEAFDNLLCLKLLFMDNNWYIAFVDEQKMLRLGRIAFIQKVEYATKISSYTTSSVQKYLDFLLNIQNSMTLYGEVKKTATLKALPHIARYFEEDMKKFLSSQKFVQKENDGSVVFTLEYTQSIEILPFIQKWLPNMVVLEPKELKEEYLQLITQLLENFQSN